MIEWIKKNKYYIIIFAIIIAIASIMIPLLAWVGPDGLERVLEDWGLGEFPSFFAPFGFSELGILGDIINGIIGICIVLGIALIIFYLMKRKNKNKPEQAKPTEQTE
ncbi:MAG: hypothetical protein ACTSPY_04555 [Candidatus Helarchaeota archaeon]